MILLTLTMGHSLRMRLCHKGSLLSATRISSSSFMDSRNWRVNSTSCSLFWIRALWIVPNAIGPNEGKLHHFLSFFIIFCTVFGRIKAPPRRFTAVLRNAQREMISLVLFPFRGRSASTAN